MARPASNTMTPSTVSATIMATTITTACPLCDRRLRAALISSVLREHGCGRGDAKQVRRRAAEERHEAVVAVDHGDDDLEAALVARVGVLRRARAKVAGGGVAPERAARRVARGVRPCAALLAGPDAHLRRPGGRRGAA